MEIFLKYGIVIFSISVFLVLVLGVFAMARGDSFNKNWSQKENSYFCARIESMN